MVALRNVVGVAIPLGCALSIGQPALGFLGSLGAMNAAFSDGTDPYLPRGRRMLAASALSALAVGAGAMAGSHPIPASLLIAVWALGAGLLVAVDQSAADIGLLSLVMVLVFVGQPMPPHRALTAALVVLAAGDLQTLLSVLLWPIRRYEPERRVIATLYSAISSTASSPILTDESPRGTAQANEAQAMIRGLGRSHTVQGDRYVSLVSQAERIRLTVLGIRHATFLNEVSLIADCIAKTLRSEPAVMDPQWFEAIEHPALAGQLRAAWELAGSSTPAGRQAFEQRQLTRPWRLRAESTIGKLRANFSFRSSAMRHALRLMVAVLLGGLLASVTGQTRSYWLPMTAAIVLKPDFTATFSRGVLRIAGTFTGLALATVLFYAVTPTAVLEFALVVVIVFIFRCFGPAHYGIFTAALTAYIVLIFALGGQAPMEVMRERALHTVLGGALALTIYAIWPTWERTNIRGELARMLESYRLYFRAVHQESPSLEDARLEARLARSNAEAGMDRFLAEPKPDLSLSTLLSAVMANSHRVVFAMIGIEAGLTERTPLFLSFAHKVEITLHSLAAALRGAGLSMAALPDLRASQSQLAESKHSCSEDADRLTNSLNTLSEQVLRLISTSKVH